MAFRRASKVRFGQPWRWKAVLRERLPLFGHRNWIVIADAAYPAQSNPAIQTVFTGSDHLAVVREVMNGLKKAAHVRPDILLDAELPAVREDDAPGVSAYRQNLSRILSGFAVEALPHEEIIVRLDEAAKRFGVLVLKTTLAIPYTSVFIRLECGYWTAAAERELRASMG